MRYTWQLKIYVANFCIHSVVLKHIATITIQLTQFPLTAKCHDNTTSREAFEKKGIFEISQFNLIILGGKIPILDDFTTQK